jgi:tetratricopeptide (TPR) repeat protein
MAINEKAYEQIESYVSGNMTAAEKMEFEKQMELDPELKETVALYRTLQESYTSIEQTKPGVLQLEKTLENVSGNYFKEEKQAPVFTMQKTFRVLAVAASLILGFLLLQPVLFTKGNKDLFKTYYQQEELSVERGETDSIVKAILFFNKNEYQQALDYLEPVTQKNPEANNLILARGECYLGLNQFDKALKSFEEVAQKETVYKDRANWLKAMAYLKQEKFTECRNFLSTIAETSTYFKTAQKLIAKLDKK